MTLIATSEMVTSLYSPPLALWFSSAASSSLSGSSIADTVTSCAVPQLSGVNMSDVLSAVMSTSEPEAKDNAIVTLAEGCVSSTMVYVALPPSDTSSIVGVTVTPAVSL